MNAPVGDLKPEVEVADPLTLLRRPFPVNQVSKLPKETKAQREERERDRNKGIRCTTCEGWHHRDAIHLDYVGHAALTDRLLDVDPHWSWEPVAFRDGLPAFDGTGGLWIKLTVAGVTRLGYGHAASKPNQDPGAREKEAIGDALRNAAMRFGAALDLWHKGDLHAHLEEPAPTAEEMAINLLRGCGSKELFADAWNKNKEGWQRVMDREAYARVVAEMKSLAAEWQKRESAPAEENAPAPPLPEERPVSGQAAPGFGIGDDDIPAGFGGPQ